MLGMPFFRHFLAGLVAFSSTLVVAAPEYDLGKLESLALESSRSVLAARDQLAVARAAVDTAAAFPNPELEYLAGTARPRSGTGPSGDAWTASLTQPLDLPWRRSARIGAAEAALDGCAAGLRAFELVLLRETGVLPDLAITTLGQQAVQPGGRYALRPESGLVAQADGGGVAGALWLALQGALDEGSAVALQRACLTHLAPLKNMLRQLLHYHLGSQRLHTREVMHSVQRLVDRSTPAAQDASTR